MSFSEHPFSEHPQCDEFVGFIEELADAARVVLSKRLNDSRFETKDDASPVTEFDRGVEQTLRSMIRDRYPEHGIIGEEFPPEKPDAEFVWIMDPIDGTKSFVTGIPTFTTLIALCHDGRPVIGIIDAAFSEERWLGVDGRATTCNEVEVRTSGRVRLDGATVSWTNPELSDEAHIYGREEVLRRSAWRVFGAAAYGVGKVASGAIDLAVESGNVNVYDMCAFVPIIEGAGGSVTDGLGSPITLRSQLSCLVAATPELLAETLEALTRPAPAGGFSSAWPQLRTAASPQR